MVESNSNEKEEERVCVIKKIKRKHIKKLTGTQKGKGVIAPASAPAPAASTAKPAEKEASVAKDPFMETLRSNDDTGNKDNKDGKGKDDGGEYDSDGIDDENGGTMDIDASGLVADASFLEALCLEEALQKVSTEAVKMIEEVEPVLAKENASA
ncbi:hypothetical protein C0995_010930 [Termitomyces sp. Mi166|nr:hypothetical protein C0995_010930 [Termitomyces sp. Mi166\